jgi:hypothetical protein
MKRTLLLVVVLLLAGAGTPLRAAATNAPALTDEQLGDEFTRAVLLISRGQDREAEPLLRQILRRYPEQPTVTRMLAEIQARRDRVTGGAYRRYLESLVVADLNTRDADVATVLDYLRTESAKVAPDKAAVNIVLLAPANARLGRITLSLHKISLYEALRYTAVAAGLALRTEPHAAVLELPAAETAPPPAREAPAAAAE